MIQVRKFIHQLFEEYKFVRRAALLWACWLITVSVLRFLDKITEINTATATTMVAIIGILTVVIGFYQWSRGRDDR